MPTPHSTGSAGGHRDTQMVRRAVATAQRGEREGLHFLYVRFADEMRRYVARILGDRHEAEDVTQEVFIKLIDRIDRYQPREAPFGAWLMRVARNVALDHLRRRRVLPIEEARIADGRDPQVDPARASSVRQAFEELPHDQREVLVLRHIVGLSPVEIANALRRTESSVHGLHHRGRRAMRARLVELGAEPVVSRGGGLRPSA